LRVEFTGEEAVDEGGVMREFFRLLSAELFAPEAGLFFEAEGSRRLWFSPVLGEGRKLEDYWMVGVIVALAVYNNHPGMDVPLPSALFKKLKDQLSLAEKILETAELCRKFETEREKVLPFYFSREVEVEDLQFDDDDLKEEIKESLSDTGIDEWTYLDTFFKRYNKVKLDHLAIEKERQRLEKENVQLRSILKQFLDGVSVNEDVLSQPNPLLVVNGKVNLNHIPVKRAHEKKVVIEAAHHVQTSVPMR